MELDLSIGDRPLAIAHISKDRGLMLVSYGLWAWVGSTILGPFGAAGIILLAINDLSYAGNVDEGKVKPRRSIAPQSSEEDEPTANVYSPAIKGQNRPIAALPPSATVPSPVKSLVNGKPRNTLIFGLPGAGKGLTIAAALRKLKKERPNLWVMWIDPKDDPKESGYFDIADCVLRKHIQKEQPEAATKWLMQCFDAFLNTEAPEGKLLVWDELFLSTSAFLAAGKEGQTALRRTQFYLSGLSSSGDSRSEWFWGATQSGNIEDLPISGGLKSLFKFVVLADKNSSVLLNKMQQNGTIPQDIAPREIIKVCEQSPVGRAFYDSDSDVWEPTPDVPNWSGYNRDRREHIGATPNAAIDDMRDQPAMRTAWQHPEVAQALMWLEANQPGFLQQFKQFQDGAMGSEEQLEALCGYLNRKRKGLTVREIQQAKVRGLEELNGEGIRKLIAAGVQKGWIIQRGEYFAVTAKFQEEE